MRYDVRKSSETTSAATWQARWAATFRALMNEYPDNSRTALVALRQAFRCGRYEMYCESNLTGPFVLLYWRPSARPWRGRLAARGGLWRRAVAVLAASGFGPTRRRHPQAPRSTSS